ncbi:MAG: BspA family leucine-rich repeat surface protein, partial [Bacteroidetes bacterium]
MKQNYYANPTRTLPTAGKTAHRWLAYGLSLFLTLACLMSAKAQTITLSTTVLSGAFSNTATNSTAQTFTASGTGLGADVSIALSTTDWELSTDNITFSPTLTLAQSSGSLTGQPVTVYVRLKQGLASGMKTATLTASSAGATNKTIALTGTANAFVTTWITTTTDITIPTAGGGYAYDIVWTNLTTGVVGNASGLGGIYTITGLTNNDTYQVAIIGTFPRIELYASGSQAIKIRTIAQWGNIVWTSMQGAFAGCYDLTYAAADNPNLSGVTSMLYMFRNCTNFNGNIGSWNTSTVTSMNGMFTNATAFNQNIGSWQLNGSVDLAGMLDNTGMNTANYDATLAGWATQSVTGRTLGANGRQYCNITDRTTLDITKNWTINGDALSGSCSPPVITLSTSTLSGAFSNTTTNSTAQTFTASGADLTGSVSIALSTTDWELSTDNITFSPTLTLTQSSGSLTGQPVTVYVRLKQGLTSGMKTATLTASSTGATNKTIALTGTANAFVTTWITIGSTITIPTAGGGNYSVIWTNLTTGAVGNATGLIGDYTITGLIDSQTYQVAITGTFPQFYMNNNANERTKIRTIAQWGNIAWGSMQNAFAGCNSLTYTATDNPNLSAVTSMQDMFAFCTNFNGNISAWNTSAVTNMRGVFYQAISFNQNIGTWNTSAVTTMTYMFSFCPNFNGTIGSWNTSAVTNMQGMFETATAFNQNIGTWNTSAVTNMLAIFKNATAFNQNIGTWQLNSNVNMGSMLDDCGMNVANYDATLAGWATQAVSARTLGASNMEYCNITNRNTLTSTKGWTIIGDIFTLCPIGSSYSG